MQTIQFVQVSPLTSNRQWVYGGGSMHIAADLFPGNHTAVTSDALLRKHKMGESHNAHTWIPRNQLQVSEFYVAK